METTVNSPAKFGRLRLGLVLVSALLLAAALWVFASGFAEAADRFGEPFQAQVTADRVVTHRRPDPNSPAVGPLDKGAIVIALDEKTGANGASWTSTNVGWLPSSALTELHQPWVAEVTVPSVDVYAYPDAGGPIRLAANKGEIFRVTGVALGVNGDSGLWWATTQGYVKPGTLKQSTNPWALAWTMPNASDAPKGWWGVIADDAHVRLGPTTVAPIVGDLPAGSQVKVLAQESGENVEGSSLWYRIDGGRFAGAWVHSSLIKKIAPPKANTTALPGGKATSWIVVDRKNASLTFVRNSTAAFVTYVSLGKVGRETPSGVYYTDGKFVADRMTSRSLPNPGGGYDLPNVPFTQYFTNDGAAVHGTYWHDEFGSPQSHGCINVTVTDGAYLFNLTTPTVPAGQNEAWAQGGNATPILVLG